MDKMKVFPVVPFAFFMILVFVVVNIIVYHYAANPTSRPAAVALPQDWNLDGDPDDKDNCPHVANPPSVVLGGPSLVCKTTSDCFVNDLSVLADGTPVPITHRGGKMAPVGVYCSKDRCVMQADSDLDGIGDACEEKPPDSNGTRAP